MSKLLGGLFGAADTASNNIGKGVSGAGVNIAIGAITGAAILAVAISGKS